MLLLRFVWMNEVSLCGRTDRDLGRKRILIAELWGRVPLDQSPH
jgi:hypothetical protein